MPCGVAAWCIRYLLLAAASYYDISSPVYVAIAIHGMCYVFVYIIGVMYVDRLVSHAHRGLAQGLYTIVYAGLANLLGAVTVGLQSIAFFDTRGRLAAPLQLDGFLDHTGGNQRGHGVRYLSPRCGVVAAAQKSRRYKYPKTCNRFQLPILRTMLANLP